MKVNASVVLKNLETFQLQDNRIKNLSDDIGLLKSLKTLNLDYNKLRTLQESIVNLINLKEFSITGNPKLISPPYLIAVQGLNAIKDWFDQSHNK